MKGKGLASTACLFVLMFLGAAAAFAQDQPEVERTVVRVVTGDPEAVEGTDNVGVFLIRREGNLHVPVTVQLRITGTAENGVDYARLPDHVTIPAGEQQVRLVVEAIADHFEEPAETVVVHIEPPVCIAIWPPPPECYLVGRPAEAVVRIYDRAAALPPRVEIVRPAPDSVFPAPATVPIEIVTRDPDGYVPRVEFFANRERIGVREVDFIVPPPPGELQRFDLTWSNVPPGEYALTAVATDDSGLSRTSAPVIIRVRSPLPVPVVRIEAVDPHATEPQPLLPAFDSARFRLYREGGDLMRSLTVRYHVGGTASNGVDYIRLPGQITFAPGRHAVELVVQPLADSLGEETESVVIELVQPDCITAAQPGPDCYAVGDPSRAIAWIRDATGTNQVPWVKLVHPPNGKVYQAPVDLRLLALAGDRDGCVLTVEFFAGDHSLGRVTNRLSILDPPLPDLAPGCTIVPAHLPVLPFTLIWSNAPPGEQILTAVATDNLGAQSRSEPVTIHILAEPEPPVVRIVATDPVAREGTTNHARFLVLASRPVSAPLSVYYRIGGTASNGVDYVEVPAHAVIPEGARAVAIDIVPKKDESPEGAETVLLRLMESPTPADAYRIGRPAVAAALILDGLHPLPGLARLADGALHLRLPYAPGLPYRIETSTNLVDWQIVGSAVCTENSVSILEPDPQAAPARFYRLVPEYGPTDADN